MKIVRKGEKLSHGTAIGHAPRIHCPLYRKDDNRRLCCEGLTDECGLQVNFRTKQAKERHLQVFCTNRYSYCELFEAIMKAKYAVEMDGEEGANG